MNCAKEARKLADYVINLSIPFETSEHANNFSYYHIGALFTDIVLQAGLNYSSVVRPRVQRVLLQYPHADTIRKFQGEIDKEGLENIINWKHTVKLERFQCLLDLCRYKAIDNCYDLKAFLSHSNNHGYFLSINGFGPKTLDYLLKLLNFDSVAVDRHIYSFVKLANIEVKGYQQTKKVVEYAADFLNISRSAMDRNIWNYMSGKKFAEKEVTSQFSFDFHE